MALIKCVDCGKEVSDRAKICPNCGCPIECSIEAFPVLPQEETVISGKVEDEPTVVDEGSPVTQIENNDHTETEQSTPVYQVQHNMETKLPVYQPPQNIEEQEKSKLGLIVIIAVVVLIVGLIVGVGIFGKINKSETPTTQRTTLPTTQSTTVAPPAVSDNAIHYISDRDVQYDDIRKRHELFFGFKNINEEYITAESGTVTVRITNTAGEEVYNGTINFTSANFVNCTNPSWDTEKLLAVVYINEADIKMGSSDRGLLAISAVADGFNFDEKEIKIYNLPSNGTYTSHYHSYTSAITTEATCLADGVRTYTCSCGDSYTQPEPKRTSHHFNTATCTEPKTCKWCGITEGEPRGHSYSSQGTCFNCNGSDPAKDAAISQCSLSLPTLPQVVTHRRSNGEMRSSVYVTAISYEFDYSSSGGVSLKVRFSGTKTFDERGDGQSDACKIGWKLYDSKGNVYETGTFNSPYIANGESFADQEATILYGYKGHKPDAYRLELLDVN